MEIRNNADNLAYQSEKQLREIGDKLSADQKQGLEEAVKKVRDSLAGEDTDAIKQAMDELQNRFQSISADLYKQASASQSTPPPQSGGEAAKGEEKVVDADFEVVDEDKKKS